MNPVKTIFQMAPFAAASWDFATLEVLLSLKVTLLHPTRQSGYVTDRRNVIDITVPRLAVILYTWQWSVTGLPSVSENTEVHRHYADDRWKDN